MTAKLYEYGPCSTCKKAIKFLNAKGIKFTKIAIVDQPPTVKELNQMVAILNDQGKSFKHLFNTSGVQYRELKIGQKLKDGLSEPDALKLLASNGKLIKRPFLLTEKSGLIGFNESEWSKLF